MRPRCCFRYFTFFGINITNFPVEALLATSFSPRAALTLPARDVASYVSTKLKPARCRRRLRLALLLLQDLALVHPALHADHAVGRASFGKSIVDISTQRVQR